MLAVFAMNVATPSTTLDQLAELPNFKVLRKGACTVYVLGTAHVSDFSAQQVRAVMRAVRPDAVMVELDDERLGVLVDFGEQQSGAADVLWYTDNTSIEPSVSLAAMPTSAELLASLHTRPGRPVTRDQISGDAQALLGTGLFARAAPAPYPPTPDMGPMYVGDAASGAIRQVNAMGRVAFQVQPQSLPAVSAARVAVDPSVAAMVPEQLSQRLQRTASEVLSSGLSQGASTLQIVCETRAQAEALLPAGTVLAFQPAADVLHVRVVLAPPPGCAWTGLEALGRTVTLDTVGAPSARTPSDERWANGRGDVGAALLREMIARPSAAAQSAQAAKLGMSKPGAEFRAALEEAVLADYCSLVVLADQPIAVTRLRIAALLYAAARGKLVVGAAAAAVVVGAAFAAGDALPVPVEGVVLGVVAACAGAGWWVLSEPAREQAITAGLSAEELGAGVQGLLENGYEDAPEAEHPVYEAALLEERDRYMAARLKALAKGEAGVAPAFVRVETQGELRFMRYRAMPQGFTGEGGKPPASIVAVVGLAHVAGICAEWDQ